MTIEPLSSLDEIIPLLAECALQVVDISEVAPPRFFGIRVAGAVVAVVGLEQVESDGLLRSLAVKAAFRRQGLAHELVKHVEARAAAWGVESLYLLTTTAEHFFLSLGYRPTPRNQAPVGIQGMPQFSDLCPTASAFLGKRIQPTTIEPEQVPS